MSKMAVVGLEKHNRLSFSYPKAAFLLGVDMKTEEQRIWQREYMKRYYQEKPWARTIMRIRSRCNGKHGKYYRRGIKNYLSLEDVRFLWFRDKAYLMKQPSIDRKDGNGHYILENCRYLEWSKHLALSVRQRKFLPETYKKKMSETMKEFWRKRATPQRREMSRQNIMNWNKKKWGFQENE